MDARVTSELSLLKASHPSYNDLASYLEKDLSYAAEYKYDPDARGKYGVPYDVTLSLVRENIRYRNRKIVVYFTKRAYLIDFMEPSMDHEFARRRFPLEPPIELEYHSFHVQDADLSQLIRNADKWLGDGVSIDVVKRLPRLPLPPL